MPDSSATLTSADIGAWRGQVATTGKRLRLRTYLLHHRHELLPRFAAVYRQLRALPRRLCKAVQRHWGVSLAGVALLLTLQPRGSHAADFTAGTEAELVTAVTLANSTAEADTITLTADITLSAAIPDPSRYTPSALIVSSTLTIAGNHHAIRREPSNPNFFRLLAVTSTGDLTVQDTTLSGGAVGDADGGAIYNHKGRLTLEGCTISSNRAALDGTGGIFSSGGTVVLTNSTISGNTGGLAPKAEQEAYPLLTATWWR